ncbi:MAG: SCO2322 family protein [Candidatus Nanopelagicales bacterium]
MDASNRAAANRFVRFVAALLVLSVSAAAVVISEPSPAFGVTSYRYWTYWTSTGGGWVYSSVGPASRVPADGHVEGWRFAVSDGANPTVDPIAGPDFSAMCAGVSAQTDHKRVGLVIDPGVVADAPAGEVPGATKTLCLSVPAAYTSAQILNAHSTIRSERGLICGIDGYPVRECAALVGVPSSAVPGPGMPAALKPASKPKKMTKKRCKALNGQWKKKSKKCRRRGKAVRW